MNDNARLDRRLAEPRAHTGQRATSVIENAIEILRCFTVDEPLQGVTSIAAEVGLHKSSVSRILSTLEGQAFVERDEPTRKYRLGLGLITVAGPLLADLEVRRVALPVLQELTKGAQETSALVVWNGTEAVIVEQVAAHRNIKHTAPLGTRYASALNSSVQVFLTQYPEEEQRTLLDGALAAPPQSSVSAAQILSRLPRIQDQGFALNYGDTYPDEIGICAPVRDHRGALVAGVLLAAPIFRVDRTAAAALAQQVVEAARLIGRRLGDSVS